MRIYNK